MGFSVLDLSKLHMYNFHYNHMCVKYPRPSQLRLLFADTDSLAYAVQAEDIYRDMVGDADECEGNLQNRTSGQEGKRPSVCQVERLQQCFQFVDTTSRR